jgi:hypothetical protein
MAEKEKVAKNPMAEAANWNARCITEEQAPVKWNEAWGQMFSGAIPHDYGERIEFLENELRNCPNVARPAKYGCGGPFPKYGADKFTKIPYDQPTYFPPEELDATWKDMQRRKREGNK